MKPAIIAGSIACSASAGTAELCPLAASACIRSLAAFTRSPAAFILSRSTVPIPGTESVPLTSPALALIIGRIMPPVTAPAIAPATANTTTHTTSETAK